MATPTINNLNEQLNKATEFRYFALLASFVFFLDSTLITFFGSGILSLSYDNLTENFTLGRILIFFTLFTCFMSFAVPLVQFCLRKLILIIPYDILEFFDPDSQAWKDVKPKDYFYLRDLERYAVLNDKSIAYDYYKQITEGNRKMEQIYYFCLALILSFLFNSAAYMQNNDALFSFFIPYFLDENHSFFNTFISLFLWALLICCFYLGVIKGGVLAFNGTDKLYFPNHNFTSQEQDKETRIRR